MLSIQALGCVVALSTIGADGFSPLLQPVHAPGQGWQDSVRTRTTASDLRLYSVEDLFREERVVFVDGNGRIAAYSFSPKSDEEAIRALLSRLDESDSWSLQEKRLFTAYTKYQLAREIPLARRGAHAIQGNIDSIGRSALLDYVRSSVEAKLLFKAIGVPGAEISSVFSSFLFMESALVDPKLHAGGLIRMEIDSITQFYDRAETLYLSGNELTFEEARKIVESVSVQRSKIGPLVAFSDSLGSSTELSCAFTLGDDDMSYWRSIQGAEDRNLQIEFYEKIRAGIKDSPEWKAYQSLASASDEATSASPIRYSLLSLQDSDQYGNLLSQQTSLFRLERHQENALGILRNSTTASDLSKLRGSTRGLITGTDNQNLGSLKANSLERIHQLELEKERKSAEEERRRLEEARERERLQAPTRRGKSFFQALGDAAKDAFEWAKSNPQMANLLLEAVTSGERAGVFQNSRDFLLPFSNPVYVGNNTYEVYWMRRSRMAAMAGKSMEERLQEIRSLGGERAFYRRYSEKVTTYHARPGDEKAMLEMLKSIQRETYRQPGAKSVLESIGWDKLMENWLGIGG